VPTLIVLRHAKAVTGLGLADHERPLADRGRGDAVRAGDHLRSVGLNPALILCSTAVRTRETLDALALEGATVQYEEDIYDNDVETLLDLIRQTDSEAEPLLLIGHNPSVHQLVHDLTGDGPDAFPTCAMAVLDLPGPWSDTWPGTGALTAMWTPKPH
jgi:phosphohistidine phosphatase